MKQKWDLNPIVVVSSVCLMIIATLDIFLDLPSSVVRILLSLSSMIFFGGIIHQAYRTRHRVIAAAASALFILYFMSLFYSVAE